MNDLTAQTAASFKKRTLAKYRNDIDIYYDGEYIRISGNPFDPSPISDDEVISLLHPNVKKIDLLGCYKITDKAIISIAEICHLIEYINVYSNKNLTEESLKAIGTKCKRLERFHAFECPNLFTEKGVENLSGCELMRYLTIFNCGTLSDNSVEVIVKSFPKLEELTLNGCDVTSLPEDIGNHLKCLKKLYLYSNKLTKLPRSITNLADTCEYFSVNGNPLQEPPIEIAKQGLEAIKRYFEELDRGATNSTQLKVVLLGNFESGKTSLRNAMAGRYPARTQKEDRTIYLDLETIVFSSEETGLPYDLTLKTYDLGGQQDYATGQAPFITGSSLFVVVVAADKVVVAADKASDEFYEKAVLRFLVLLQTRAPGALVQLVLSKIDLISETECNERIKWLQKKVNETLEQWRRHSVNHEAKDPAQLHDRGPSVQPLRVLPNVISVSVKDFDDSQREEFISELRRAALEAFVSVEDYEDVFVVQDIRSIVRDFILKLVQDEENPMLPTVGQRIPNSWLTLRRLLDAVSEYGTDAPDKILFEAARSEDSRSLSDEKRPETSSPGAYCTRDKLRSIWDRFCEKNQDITVSDFTFDDALRLLNAQGSVFVDAELVFLRPSFVTDLLRPLIDHRLTPEYVKSKKFKETVQNFVREYGGERKPLLDALEKLTRTGELDAIVLPFLWRDIEGLDPDHYGVIVKMLYDADVIFGPSFPIDHIMIGIDSPTRQMPMVLFRLPDEPPSREDLDDLWPTEIPDGKQQLELHVQLWAGCPQSLAAHFAAKAHSLGHCIYAWLNGAVVIDKDDDDRLIRCERTQKDGSSCLVMSVREPMLGRKTLELFKYAVEFVEKEKTSRLPGLLFDVAVACPFCVSRGLLTDRSFFQWRNWERAAEGEKFCCVECNRHVSVEVKVKGNKSESSVNTKMLSLPENTEKDVGELSLDNVDNPSQKWPMSKDPYVFLSHTGRDDVKEEVARPTYWFLTNILRVRAFLDDLSLAPGNKVTEALIPPAYECSHALVFLSPTFREREFCVRELNTFMARLRRNDGIRLLPALWLIKNVDAYHPDLDDIIWIGSRGTKYCVKYLVEILWPALIDEFECPKMTRKQLKDHLVEYVKSHRGGVHPIPSDLEESMPSESTCCNML